MLIFNTILLAASTLALAEASAIKGGYARKVDMEVRSIAAKQSPVQAEKRTAILESTKRLFNDEALRRLAVQPVVHQAPAPAAVHEQLPSRPEAAIPAAPANVVVASAEQALSHAASEAVVQAAPVLPAVIRDQKPQAVVEAKSGDAKAPEEPIHKEKAVEKAVEKSEVEPKNDKPSEKAEKVAEKPAPEPVSMMMMMGRSEVVPKAEVQPPVAVAEPVVPVVQPVVAAAPVAPVEAAAPVAPIVEPIIPVVAAAAAAAPSAPIVEPVVQPIVPVVAPVQPAAAASAEAPLEARKEEPAKAEPELHIEVPAPDPQLVLSEPIDSTTKLLIDLDEHVQKFLPFEEQAQAARDSVAAGSAHPAPIEFSGAHVEAQKPTGPLVPYASVDEPIVPPLPSLDGVEKASSAQSGASPSASSSSSGASGPAPAPAGRQGSQNQNQQQMITGLLDQLDSLQTRIQDTINQLVARRRYVMAALLRPMGTYVRRVRTNLERLQTRVNQLQAAAVSVGGGQNRPGGLVDQAAIETIKHRIEDISKRISEIVNRIRISLVPTSAPMNSNGK